MSGLTSGVRTISAGLYHTCAVTTSGVALCWGRNDAWGGGQLGDGTTVASAVPVPVTGLQVGVAAVSCSSGHSCAVFSNGSVACWGEFGSGLSATNALVPVLVPGLSGATLVAASDINTCALATGGAACKPKALCVFALRHTDRCDGVCVCVSLSVCARVPPVLQTALDVTPSGSWAMARSQTERSPRLCRAWWQT